MSQRLPLFRGTAVFLALAAGPCHSGGSEDAAGIGPIALERLPAQEQARRIEVIEEASIAASLIAVGQRVTAGGSPVGARSRMTYRGDVSLTLPGGGRPGGVEGRIFSHLRVGHGGSVRMRPSYTSSPNTVAVEPDGGAQESFATLAQAWYQLKIPLQESGARHIHLTAGKVDPFVFFDQNAAADDESAKFLNNVFVHNPLLDSGGDIGANVFGFTPGAIAQYVDEKDEARTWSLSLGAFGPGHGTTFSSSLSSPFFIAQADTAWRRNGLAGNYRAYAWSNPRGQGYDGAERRHAGWGVSVDQQIDAAATVFGRYGRHLKGKALFDRALTVGVELSGRAWQRADDAIGLAFGALRTSRDFRADSEALDANLDGTPDFGYSAQGWEKQAEIYYRLEPARHFELTPNVQFIRRARGDDRAPTVRIAGIRVKLGF